MEYYKGKTTYDIPINGGNWVNKNEDAGDAHNFTNCGGWYYGYVRPENLNINRIEKTNRSTLSNTLVIFFATQPKGGQCIVGWYKNAEVFKKRQVTNHKNRQGYYEYNVRAKKSYLVPAPERWFFLPVKPGENNVWYGKDYLSKKEITEIISYVNNPIAYKKKKVKNIRLPKNYKFENNLPRQPDIEKKRKVEKAAIDEVWRHFKLKEFDLEDVSDKNYGWDLEARLNNTVLKIEVKGLSGKELLVELTPNEYLEFIKKNENYRLAVLTNALEENKKLRVFQFFKKVNMWMDVEKNPLKLIPIQFARICLENKKQININKN